MEFLLKLPSRGKKQPPILSNPHTKYRPKVGRRGHAHQNMMSLWTPRHPGDGEGTRTSLRFQRLPAIFTGTIRLGLRAKRCSPQTHIMESCPVWDCVWRDGLYRAMKFK